VVNDVVLRVAEILKESLQKSGERVRTDTLRVSAVRDCISTMTPDKFWDAVKNTIKDPAVHAEFVERARPLVSALY
jgi:hypothetical protein